MRCAPLGPIGCIWAVAFLGSTDLSAQIKGAAVPADPIAQLNQRLDALTQRVSQLELAQANFVKSLSKPDVPDDAGGSTKKALAQAQPAAGGTSSSSTNANASGNASDPAKDPPYPPSQGTNSLSVAQRLSALENRHSYTAPFNVTDSAGKLIFRVEDAGNGGGRGAYVFDSNSHLVVAAYAAGGGKIDALNGSDTELRARLSNSASGPSLSLIKDNFPLAELFVQGGTGNLDFNADSHPIAGIHTTGTGGLVFINGSGDAQASLSMQDGSGAVLLGPRHAEVVRINSDATGGFVQVGKADAADSTLTKIAANQGLGLIVKSGGTAMDYIGVGNDGENGQMGVFSGGKIVASLQTYGGGKGQVSVFNSAGTPIAFLAESEKHPGGGNMTATDPAGNGVFSGGYTGGSSGDACVDYRSGSLKCVGASLPLAAP